MHFLSGAIFIATLSSALFFLRFWNDTGDRFFLLFSFAFILFGVERVALLVDYSPIDFDGSTYLFRLVAFIIILLAIAHKNRSSRPTQ